MIRMNWLFYGLLSPQVYTLVNFIDKHFLLARSLSYYAFALGSVTLASILLNTQVFYGIFLGVILTLIFPRVFRESISKKDLFIKSGAAIILFLGVFLLN